MINRHLRNSGSILSLQLMLVMIATAQVTPAPQPNPFESRDHTVQEMNGDEIAGTAPADMQWISRPWNGENAQMPYLVYMPEKDRLLMLVECKQPIQTAFIESNDHGATWSERRWMSTGDDGQPNAVALGLTYLGNGKLIAYPENAATERWSSADYGATWQKTPTTDTAKERYIWDPLLVIKNETGAITKIAEASWRPTGIPWGSTDGDYSQAYFRTSADQGLTWTDEIKVPQWAGVNEVALFRAPNGHWVAACRTDNPKRFAPLQFDHYSGLGISTSTDEGATWTKLNLLYEFGRHHPSLLTLPDGRILMTYAVRLGYPDTPDGFPQFGVEAVISPDNGQTWDLQHRRILAKWTGNIKGPNAWFCSVQSTSTVQLPDGTILTTFGTGFRNPSDATICKMDVALIRWRVSSQ